MRSQVRDSLVGFVNEKDRVWSITMPEFVGFVAEHDGMITGYNKRLSVLEPKFHFGANAYEVLGKLCAEKGWAVKELKEAA